MHPLFLGGEKGLLKIKMHDIGFLLISDMLIFYNSLWLIQIFIFVWKKRSLSRAEIINK